MRLATLFLALAAALAAQHKPITPAGAAKPVGPYSPAIDTGQYVYVSGQGARDGDGAMPAGIEAQTRQCLANVRMNLEAAGLEFRHVISAQLYLVDMETLPTVERLWTEILGATQPPHITLGVTRLPTDTPIEITVVARRATGDRVYLSPIYAQTRQQAEKQLTAALKKAGLNRKHLEMANWYTTGVAAPGVIGVAALPDKAQWAVAAVAAKRKETSVFCEVVSPKPAGTVEQQTTEAFAGLKACLAKRGATLAAVAATNVYLADIADFARMNAIYASMFSGAFPSRTTIQSVAPAKALAAVRLSAIAEKP
ncbi:MAG TPA: RidA family protein [Paludibaculum sp.]|jgi:2-iminobutanoate/2-iminopropanoate deaminase